MYNNTEYEKTYITTGTTTTVFSGKGKLMRLIIDSPAGTITLKDNGVTFKVLPATTTGVQTYEVAIGNTLSIVTSSTPDLLVVWSKA